MKRLVLSWGLQDVPEMLANAGQRCSARSGGDSNATRRDPLWVQGKKAPFRSGDLDEADRKEFVKGHYRMTREMPYLAAPIVVVASQMRHNDLCLIFGRDMYPAQGLLKAWETQLRGSWFYFEGLSREVVRRESALERVWRTIKSSMRKRGSKPQTIFLIDTGFEGSIPRAVAHYIKGRCIDKGIEMPKFRVFLGSSVHSKRAACPILDTTGWEFSSISFAREHVLKIEHMPKPFMRAIRILPDGRPELRLSRRQDILRAAGSYQAALDWASCLDVPFIIGGLRAVPRRFGAPGDIFMNLLGVMPGEDDI